MSNLFEQTGSHSNRRQNSGSIDTLKMYIIGSDPKNNENDFICGNLKRHEVSEVKVYDI